MPIQKVSVVIPARNEEATIGVAQARGARIILNPRAIRQGYPLVEVATHENKRAGGKMKSRAFRDGFAIMLAVLREGLAYRTWRLCHWRRSKP